MNTPICDFVNEYSKNAPMRLHMPGHKGHSMLGIEKYDITEVDGADVLYSANGIIEESQNNASELFSTSATFYSCEGSSLSIRAMLYLACIANEGKSKCVLAARNAHKAFFSAVSLLDLDVSWMYGENFDAVSSRVGANDVKSSLEELKAQNIKPLCVYITSPDYLGYISDIKGISEVCREYGVLLLVDNAHGAYLKFLDGEHHPIEYADMCCDSAHKTLPVLTGGGYLHISKKAPDIIVRNAKRALSMFASTSPSYLILNSLDMANKYISDGYREKLSLCAKRIDELKNKLLKHGFELYGNERIKLTLLTRSYGYYGHEVYEYLKENNVICEFADKEHLVMMFTPEISDSDICKVESLLLNLERRAPICEITPKIGKRQVILSAKDVMMKDFTVIPAKESCGYVLACDCVSCPPAIPIVACGELIDKEAVELFLYYGVENVRVVNNGK